MELEQTIRELRGERREARRENEKLAIELGRAIQRADAAQGELQQVETRHVFTFTRIVITICNHLGNQNHCHGNQDNHLGYGNQDYNRGRQGNSHGYQGRHQSPW